MDQASLVGQTGLPAGCGAALVLPSIRQTAGGAGLAAIVGTIDRHQACCHIDRTYPFVLYWSCPEAMSAGKVLVASDTGPVREVIAHGVNGLLVDFFDVQGLARQVCEVLADPQAFAHLGQAARQTVQQRYDLRSVCLPRQIELITNASRPAAHPVRPTTTFVRQKKSPAMPVMHQERG